MSVIAATSGAVPAASGVTTRSQRSANGPGRQQNVLLVKGAAECVLSRCSKVGRVKSIKVRTGAVLRQGYQLHALRQTGRKRVHCCKLWVLVAAQAAVAAAACLVPQKM